MTQTASATLISHKGKDPLNLSHFVNRLEDQENLALPLEEEINLVKELLEFDLGRWLLEHKGLNGYWTSYIILHGPKKTNLPALERWMLTDAPAIKATQERFHIFQEQIHKRLKSGMTLASIPCGLMDDLLSLDYETTSNIQLIGIDLDQESLDLAKENAQKHNLQAQLIQKNAWDLQTQNAYDLITSNGLNIYEPDETKVIALYQEFHKALKPGGFLITSFLTPPPTLSKESPWKNFNPKDALKQKALLGDIIQAGWQTFRTEKQMRNHLEQAGFKILDIIYDTQSMFPTIISQKNES